MSAFRDRFLAWLKTFAYRYHNQMGDLPDFTTVWLDKVQHNEGPIVEIFIQLYKGGAEDDTRKESNKLLTFHLYPSTFVITAQGNHHKYWVDHEFTYMKSIVDTLCKNESSEMSDKHDLDFSDTNYSQFVTMLDLKTDDSQTELKATSSPKTDISETHPKLALQNLVKNDIDREGMAASKPGINKNPLTPDKHADVITSIQILENEMCGLSKTLDKHLENIELKLEIVDKHDELINTIKSDIQSYIDTRMEKFESILSTHLSTSQGLPDELTNKLDMVEKSVNQVKLENDKCREYMHQQVQNFGRTIGKITEFQELNTKSMEEKIKSVEAKNVERDRRDIQIFQRLSSLEENNNKGVSEISREKLSQENDFLKSENELLKTKIAELERKLQVSICKSPRILQSLSYSTNTQQI